MWHQLRKYLTQAHQGNTKTHRSSRPTIVNPTNRMNNRHCISLHGSIVCTCIYIIIYPCVSDLRIWFSDCWRIHNAAAQHSQRERCCFKNSATELVTTCPNPEAEQFFVCPNEWPGQSWATKYRTSMKFHAIHTWSHMPMPQECISASEKNQRTLNAMTTPHKGNSIQNTCQCMSQYIHIYA
jgi:hypothetical protein